MLSTEAVRERRREIDALTARGEAGDQASYQEADEKRADLFADVVAAVARGEVDRFRGDTPASVCAAACGWMPDPSAPAEQRAAA